MLFVIGCGMGDPSGCGGSTEVTGSFRREGAQGDGCVNERIGIGSRMRGRGRHGRGEEVDALKRMRVGVGWGRMLREVDDTMVTSEVRVISRNCQ